MHLPAPFSPSTAWTSPRWIVEVDGVVGDERAEALGDAPGLEQCASRRSTSCEHADDGAADALLDDRHRVAEVLAERRLGADRRRRRARARRCRGARRSSPRCARCDRKSCIRTRRMRSLTWRRKPTATSLPAAVGQADVERLVEQHEVRVGLGRRLVGERPPLVAQRLEDGRVVARAEPGRALQGLQLEPGAHLVEVAHHGDVGDDRLVAAVGVRADEALGVAAA